ncbi:hypothetical protein [Ktedonobacter racemifer]|nr:hypothetical protein [Ktedonobacter racemifer]
MQKLTSPAICAKRSHPDPISTVFAASSSLAFPQGEDEVLSSDSPPHQSRCWECRPPTRARCRSRQARTSVLQPAAPVKFGETILDCSPTSPPNKERLFIPRMESRGLSSPTFCKSSGSSKRRYSVQIIVCLVLLGIAGISWLLQQVNLMPPLPAQEAQQQTTSAATPIGTSGIQITPIQTSTAAHRPTKTPTKVKPTQPAVVPTTPPTQVAKPPVTSTGIISFEDGGQDGWVHSDPDGTVSALKNLSTSSAKDGSHVLMVSYNSDNNQSYPTFETGQLPKTLNAGQTVRTYILKTQGSNVEASLYIADQNDTWYKSMANSDIVLVNNAQTWYSVSFTVPSNIQGPATKVGIILLGYNAVVYIDAYSW